MKARVLLLSLQFQGSLSFLFFSFFLLYNLGFFVLLSSAFYFIRFGDFGGRDGESRLCYTLFLLLKN